MTATILPIFLGLDLQSRIASQCQASASRRREMTLVRRNIPASCRQLFARIAKHTRSPRRHVSRMAGLID